MRTRTLVLALLGLGAAGATAGLLAQHGNYGGPGGTTLVMSYSGPTGMATNEEGQPPTLPALPQGVTLDMIRAGDAIFHGKGGRYTCHGPEATGMPDKGSALTDGVSFQPDTWPDSVVSIRAAAARRAVPGMRAPPDQTGRIRSRLVSAFFVTFVVDGLQAVTTAASSGAWAPR